MLLTSFSADSDLPCDKLKVLTLPRNDSFGDALRRLSEAVNLVAFLENRSPESVLVDLRDRESSNQLSIDN
jgi:hypothetical protein